MASSSLETIMALPDISFIEDVTLEDIQDLFFKRYQDAYAEQTGKTATLARGDPMRVALLSASVLFYQALQCIDRAGKMNYIKYAYGDYLDLIAATRAGVTRLPAAAATVTVVWTLSAVRFSSTGIPAGTRVTADGQVFFATDEYLEIPAGETTLTTTMTCTVAGAAGNGYAPGEVATIADPVPFVASVRNTDTSSGGSEVEDDDALRQRIFTAPSGFSVAGPEEAYEYRCHEFSPLISDVAVSGPDEDLDIPLGTVDIRVLMADGTGPQQAFIDELLEWLTYAPVRPLTDHVQISAPDFVTYNVVFTYYIDTASRSSAAAIQTAVGDAVNAYTAWQSGKIGRDINPDVLVSAIRTAGAKRAVITAPTFMVLSPLELAKLGTVTVTYGGLEDG